MTTTIDLRPLATAAADYRQAVARIEDAAAAAESAWRLLPTALDSAGTQLAAGRFVGPARELATGLLDAADALHNALLSQVDCAATIAAIRGGESGSVALPRPGPSSAGSTAARPASFVVPLAPIGATLPRFGGALLDGAAAAESFAAAGLLGTLGLVLSLGGSTDSAAAAPKTDNRRPRPGVDDVRITPYTPCDPITHGPGCQLRHLQLGEPGDEPFTGSQVTGDEPPGEMPGTQEDWTMHRADNDEGWVYKSPDGKSMRVVEPGRDARYPNGYVMFRNTRNQPVDLGGTRTVSPRSDAAHVTRNPDGSFPIPEGWTK